MTDGATEAYSIAMLSFISKYRRFLSFVVVGGVCTLLHASVVVALVELLGVLPTIANALAFLTANVFSYLANSAVTFGKPRSFVGYGRFLITSLATFFMAVGFAGAGDVLKVHYLVSLAIVLTITPVTSYLLMRKFAFTDRK